MRIVTFEDQNGRRIGLLDRDVVADVTSVDRGLPSDTVDLVRLGSAGLGRLRTAFESRPPKTPRPVAYRQEPGHLLADGSVYNHHRRAAGHRRTWLRTWVNGELRQEAPISSLIFDVPLLIAAHRAVMTLEPGDVFATGTGLGVGIVFDAPRSLRPGDRVEIAIDGIGGSATLSSDLSALVHLVVGFLAGEYLDDLRRGFAL
jgi:hypothetical protein